MSPWYHGTPKPERGPSTPVFRPPAAQDSRLLHIRTVSSTRELVKLGRMTSSGSFLRLRTVEGMDVQCAKIDSKKGIPVGARSNKSSVSFKQVLNEFFLFVFSFTSFWTPLVVGREEARPNGAHLVRTRLGGARSTCVQRSPESQRSHAWCSPDDQQPCRVGKGPNRFELMNL